MQPTALVLLPPILVLLMAIVTQRLQLSLILGLGTSALIAKQLDPLAAVTLIIQRLYDQISSIENMYAYIFLLCIGIIITVLNYTGAAYALAVKTVTRITTTRQVEYATFGLSLLLALDDYLNSLTVGYVMRPLADKFGISRTKLAYLVHTFAGPLVMIVPISTWAAFITLQLDQAHTVTDPFYIYLQSISFIYYALFTIATAFIIIHTGWSFGPMQKYEYEVSTQNISPQITNPEFNTTRSVHLSDLLIPLSTLFVSVFLGMLYMGDYWLFGGNQTFIGAFKTNQNALLVLGIASIITLIITLLLALSRKQINCAKIPFLIYNGIELMGSAILLVILASTLGTILRIDLQTGHYVASMLLQAVDIIYVPFIFFIVASATSFMIGTAWGTIALLLPIGIPMIETFIQGSSYFDSTTCISIAIGAILAGATFGDHTSPISSAVVMSATSCGCTPLEHLRTQLPYTIPPLIGSSSAFLITGILITAPRWIMLSSALGIGFLITGALLYMCNNLCVTSYEKN